MKADKTQNFQDFFLNILRKKKMPVTVYLINGVKLQGVIGSFDNFCVTLRRGPLTQLIYKHAIATVVPSGPLTAEDFGVETSRDVPLDEEEDGALDMHEELHEEQLEDEEAY